MTGEALCLRLAEIGALRRMLNRTSSHFALMVLFDYAGASVAGGGGDDEAACESAMVVDGVMVSDLLDFVESDPEGFADIYDAEVLRLLLELKEADDG